MHAANPFDLSEFIAAGGTAVTHWSVLRQWTECHKNAADQQLGIVRCVALSGGCEEPNRPWQNKQQSAILESGPSKKNQQQAVMQSQVKAMVTEDDAANAAKQAAT